MTVSQKAALSLLISVLLFAVFSVLAFTGLFNLIEARFYDPSITSSLNRELNRNAASIEDFLNSMQARFSAVLSEPSVKRSFLSNQTPEDIYERSRIFGVIQESLGGFQWARFIDSEGIRLNYSTYPSDILNQDRSFVAYRNYPGLTGAVPYESIASRDGDKGRYIFDEEGDRILFTLPFYDYYEAYRGTALFSITVRALSEQLINEGLIKAGDDVSVISAPQGVLIGSPVSAGKSLFSQVASVWQSGIFNLSAIMQSNTAGSDSSPGFTAAETLILLSVKTGQGFFVGSLKNENVFSFPMPMKIILLVSFFLTVYLTFFLLLNLRQDSITIVQNRLKQLQISLIEQYYDSKANVDWGRWSRELELRRDEIRAELKKGIRENLKTGSKTDIDLLIDKSWDELLAVIGGRREIGIDEEKLQSILSRILASPAAVAAPADVQPAADTAGTASGAEAEPVEELQDAEPVEELEDAEPAEAVEELQDADEAEPLEELDEAEPAAVMDPSAETLDELQDADAAEELQDTGGEMSAIANVYNDAESLDEPEELEELDEFDETIAAGIAEPAQQPVPEIDLEELARQIEFSETAIAEDEEMVFSGDLEIASPFKTMFTEIDTQNWTEANISEAEALGAETPMPAFGAAASETEPQLAEALPDAEAPASETEPQLAEALSGAEAPASETEPQLAEALPDAEAPASETEPQLAEALPGAEAPASETEPQPVEALPDNEPQIAEVLPVIENPEDDLPELEAISSDDYEEEEKKNLKIPDSAFSASLNQNLSNQDLSNQDLSNQDLEDVSELEELPLQISSPVIYKPFLTAFNSDPQVLQTEDEEIPEELEELPESVIEEKDGVPFIKKSDMEIESIDLDKDFKNLVDSIME